MNFFVPVMLYGWVPLTIIFFFTMTPRRAVLYSVIGGVLFLPMASFDFPLIPKYSKVTAIGIGLALGGWLSGKRNKSPFHWTRYDIPMILFCFFCPITSSLSNGLGLYDGLSASFAHYFEWGVFYWAGRVYFGSPRSLREISIAIIYGGIIYVPLCLFEFRMSPQLSNIFYGFFPHSFAQHFRYGGWRPIVFMQHGLMVALWMALSTSVSFWLWRHKEILHIKGIPMGLMVLIMFIVTLFCRSANGWTFLFLGTTCCFYYQKTHTVRFLQAMLLCIPLYMIFRLSGLVTGENIKIVAGMLFDQDRISSLSSRLLQEDLFTLKTKTRLFWGWGDMMRAWPRDIDAEQSAIHAIDSLWVIIFAVNGLIGLVSFYFALLIGPWRILGSFRRSQNSRLKILGKYKIDAVVLCFVVIAFMMDSLLNGMANPIYVLCSGALMSCYIYLKEKNASMA